MNDMQKYRVIGMMSGTSVDGLDICYSEYTIDSSGQIAFIIKAAATYPYADAFAQRLIDAIHVSAEELCQLDMELGEWIGDKVCHFIDQHSAEPHFIASHGHTIFHQPERGLTVQIGNGQKIHQLTSVPVVYDFRVLDVVHGGQGAPLVPIGDQMLFGDFASCVNIGGFANLSFEDDGRRAYDICATNIVLNELAQKLGKPYDEGGSIAASHHVDQNLLNALNEIPYYQDTYPKSLGKEWVEQTIKPILNRFNHIDTGDQISTYSQHMGLQISKAISSHTPADDKVLITGGGAFNTHLIETIERLSSQQIVIPEPLLVNYKEALVFGLMGLLRVLNRPNCLASVTGADKNTSGGTVIGTLR